MTVHTTSSGTKTVDPRFRSRLKDQFDGILVPEAKHWYGKWLEDNNVLHGDIGWTVLASCNGEEIYEASIGTELTTGKNFTPDSVIWLDLLTRTYFRYALLKMVADGRISSLSTTVESILSTGGTGMSGMTIEHLLRGTVAFSPFQLWDFPNDSWFTTWKTKQERIDEFKDLTPIGSHGNISWGADLGRAADWITGHVVEEVTGKSWEDAIQDEVITPLNLSNTFPTLNHARAAGATPILHGMAEIEGGAGTPRVPLGYRDGQGRSKYSIDVEWGVTGMYGSLRDYHKVVRAGVQLGESIWTDYSGGDNDNTETIGIGLICSENIQSTTVDVAYMYLNYNGLSGRVQYLPDYDVLVTMLADTQTETDALNFAACDRALTHAVAGNPVTESSYMTDGVYTG